MKCPACHGAGGDWEPVLYYGFGGGPWEKCWACKGWGFLRNRKFYYRVLGWLSWLSNKRRKK